jgi:hypothetical protein
MCFPLPACSADKCSGHGRCDAGLQPQWPGDTAGCLLTFHSICMRSDGVYLLAAPWLSGMCRARQVQRGRPRCRGHGGRWRRLRLLRRTFRPGMRNREVTATDVLTLHVRVCVCSIRVCPLFPSACLTRDTGATLSRVPLAYR